MNYMKNILKLMTVLGLFLCLFSCKEEVPVEPSLEVTPANIDGVWQLSEWDGQALGENTYCYVIFHRKDKTFEMYQKFDSMYARYITGTFSIEKDPYVGYVISGVYDYENGDWNNEYVVTDLFKSGSMTWTVKDGEEVTKYVRCESVPEEIVNEAKISLEEE